MAKGQEALLVMGLQRTWSNCCQSASDNGRQYLLAKPEEDGVWGRVATAMGRGNN